MATIQEQDNSSSSESSTPHIIVTAKNNQSHRIMHYYGCYDPLQYPLIFPYGECGWVQGLQKLNSNAAQRGANVHSRISSELSQTVECLCRTNIWAKVEVRFMPPVLLLQIANPSRNMLLRTDGVFKDDVVDMYVKIENTRLDYFRNNQETIRAELYQGILDTVGAGEHRAANIGKRVILPPTFLGGPRDMKKRYLNSMALIHRFGKPDLFVTMTCNANWPEIKDQLASGEEAQNRPDLVARVFRAKLLALKKQIVEKQIFGEVAARRNTGDVVVIRKHNMDNRWVIPYNPYLLSLFDCHLNVEVCSTMHAVKYLYKYIYKGHDRVSFSLAEGEEPQAVDEISQYQTGRWVSPCEAAWRIFGFDLFETQPPVMPLQTSATEGCPKLLYGEFTEHYRWDTGSRTWEKRKNKVIAIGRLVFVAPAEGERFFLRLLLLHIRGPTSFEYLKTVDGYVCATFQEAALRHRLVEEEDAAELCMAEACAMQMPIVLRRLFSTLLIFAQPKDPSLLWSTHYESLSDDFRFQFPDDPLKISQLTARAVERYLEAMGKTMAEFGLDHLDTCTDDDARRNRDIVDALDAAIPEDCRLCKSLLNLAQKRRIYNNYGTHTVVETRGILYRRTGGHR
ncbi:uncharacterized protein LOC141595678 [Silene latifolia]|uniref:uncharacterized protein LOC141595678 n=1 Tax=Silene latifolia TaxID=37657 RepID=UPI003D782929